ncbi:MAG: polymer-forming cytoskeletal protein [Brevundimonas sp.]|uniref:bactofilin family protein n=1 Tax=Brevundimonas sp. TaxID=1871086 RepID=UPI001A23FF6F|nr:polymer-forming cytoskeletal protein [Brevundimonas sp.]MBJ7448412.1 polymer-forming cytoskeletal protein [Brevundimonas sp.]
MFNKSKSDDSLNIPSMTDRPPEPARAPETPRPTTTAVTTSASAPRSTNLSTLSAGVRYEGNISGGGDVQVDGALKGDVRLARVLIGESGSVEGAITADMIEVRGKVNGSITAKSVRLLATARVEGDITQEQLAIEPGAWFQGRSIQAKRELPTAAAIAEAEAAKPERYQPETPVAPAMPNVTVASSKSTVAQAKSA